VGFAFFPVMKLKQIPEDFQVEELADLQPTDRGAFACYQLEKRGLGTPEAVQAICRKWKLRPRDVSYGGLKDRHALTKQFLTVVRGPHRGFRQPHLHVQYLGQLSRPFAPEHVRGNRFTIVLREMSPAGLRFAKQALVEAKVDGVANYFDDQRFGSVGPQGEFVARKLIDEDYEGALKLAILQPYEFDRPAQRAEKRILRECWGLWSTAQARLPRGTARELVNHLVQQPGDFRGTFARLRDDIKSLYLAAYQSHLWNQILSRWLQNHCRREQLTFLQLQLGKQPTPRRLEDAQRTQLQERTLPLPSARLKLAAEDPLKPLYDAVLEEEGLTLAQMKLRHFREPFFAKGERAAMLVPERLEHEVEADELHRGTQKLLLRFDLPRGAYATMIVKRITSAW
jgi:tRNA pseudouridine13 synthase